MQTDKLVPYKKGNYPQLPGGTDRYLDRELTKAQHAVTSTQSVLKSLEAAGTITTKAGAVVAADIADGSWCVINDTENNTVGLYANVGGTLFSVALA